MARWFPQRRPGAQSFAEAFAAGERGGPGSRDALLAVVADPSHAGLVRASALVRLGGSPGRAGAAALLKALDDGDAVMRETAARQLRTADPALRLRVLPRLLGDPERSVRMEAARSLAGVPERRLAEADRARFDVALAEYEAALRFTAERPESHTELGALHLVRGRPDAAVEAFRAALRLDPAFAPASVNLADFYRSRGMEPEAQAALLAAVKASPRDAGARHALGLSYARQKRRPEALAALAEAAKLEPGNPRFAYVHAVALHDSGKRAEATKLLEAALVRHPYDRDLLFALASYERDRGDVAKASQRARLLVELDPDDLEVRRFADTIAPARR